MTKKDRAKAELRRTAREQRREAQRRAAAQRRRQRTLIWSAVGAVIVLGVFALLAWSGALGLQAAAVMGRKIEAGKIAAPPGDRVPEAAPIHIQQGARGSGYTTNPPTSGEHYGTSEAPWGVHTQQFPDEMVLHNLEHGGIWISYKDPAATELAAKLAQVARRYSTKVIVTPRPQNDAPIAVAAWGHLLKLPAFDEQKIVAFINAYRGKVGPEPGGP